MIYNDESIEIGLVEAIYGDWISIKSTDNKKEIVFNFNKKKFNFNDIDIGKTLDLKKYLNWDVGLKINETTYLFDLSKDKVILTKIDDNKFILNVDVVNPDMIYIYNPIENKTFKNLKINIEIFFVKNRGN